MSITARRQLRIVARDVISLITGVNVESPGDWAIQPVDLPSIRLRAPNDRKASIARTLPEFTTTVTLEIMATVEASDEESAQDAIEALGERIESAFFRAKPLIDLCQQFSSVSTQVSITSDGSNHIAQMLMSVDCETLEVFEPYQPNSTLFPLLEQISVNVDLTNRFDPTGTYASPPFPASVTPAPRAAGPDGRDEGALLIDLQTIAPDLSDVPGAAMFTSPLYAIEVLDTLSVAVPSIRSGSLA